ncbi:MAG: hypothetical protein M1127_03450 [Patescibacteria group bacterium]|nr:hypothetical protein [Patescibacteria group bacterium]
MSEKKLSGRAKEQLVILNKDSVGRETERKNKFFEQIKQKVDIAKSLLDFVEEHRNDDIPTLKSACEKKKKETAEIFADSLEKRQKQVLKLDKAYIDANEKMKDVEREIHLPRGQSEKSEFSQENKKKLKLLEEKFRKISDRMLTIQGRVEFFLHSHRDADFVVKANYFLDGLIMKKKEVIEHKETFSADPVFFFRDALGYDNYKAIRLKDKIRADFSGFDANIILPSKDFEAVTGEPPDVVAQHIVHSVFNLIKDTENLEDYIKHEAKHSLFELFIDNKVPKPQRFLTNIQKHINEFGNLEETGAETSRMEKQKKSMQTSVENYIFDVFEELIVEMDSMETGQVGSFFSYMSEVSKGLSSFLSFPLSPELKEILSGFCDVLKKQFAALLSELSTAFFVGGKTGKLDDVKMALVVLSPEEIIRKRKLTKFTEYIVGKRQYDLHSGIEGLVGTDLLFNAQQLDNSLAAKTIWENKLCGFFEPSNIKKAASILQTNQNSLRLENKERQMMVIMLHRLSKERLHKIIKNIDNFPDFHQDIQIIAEKLDLDILLDFVDNVIRPKFEPGVSEK